MRNKCIALFPGQGIQHSGMGDGFYQDFSAVRELYTQASEILGYDLKRTIDTGESLDSTLYAQPAIFVMCISLFSLIKQVLPNLPWQITAGHSLGEVSALVAADVLDFKQGVSLIKKRAELMEKASKTKPGAMLAILGKSVREITLDNDLFIANDNSPQQVVISGGREKIEHFAATLKENNIKSVLLATSGAFHCPYMHEVVLEYNEFINTLSFQAPKMGVVPNILAAVTQDPEIIKQALVTQMSSRVRWQESMQHLSLLDENCTFVEIGSNTLTKINRRNIDITHQIFSIQSSQDLEQLSNL